MMMWYQPPTHPVPNLIHWIFLLIVGVSTVVSEGCLESVWKVSGIHFGPIFLGPKFLGLKIFLDPKLFWNQIFFDHLFDQKFLDPKVFFKTFTWESSVTLLSPTCIGLFCGKYPFGYTFEQLFKTNWHALQFNFAVSEVLQGTVLNNVPILVDVPGYAWLCLCGGTKARECWGVCHCTRVWI